MVCLSLKKKKKEEWVTVDPTAVPLLSVSILHFLLLTLQYNWELPVLTGSPRWEPASHVCQQSGCSVCVAGLNDTAGGTASVAWPLRDSTGTLPPILVAAWRYHSQDQLDVSPRRGEESHPLKYQGREREGIRALKS